MTKLLSVLLICWLSMLGAAMAEEFPPVSGMARLASSSILLVQDTKADKPGPRLQVATLAPGVMMLRPVLEVWPGGDLPSDLEAISPLTDRPGEFLVAESGYWEGRFGRIFHIRVSDDGNEWRSESLGIIQLPQLKGEIEGIAAAPKPGGGYALVLGERGGQAPYAPAWLWWGNLDLDAYTFSRTEESQWPTQLMLPDKSCFPLTRGCSDLWLDEAGYLWGSAADDMGEEGPFRSWVYRIGRFDPSQPYPLMYEYNRDLVWRIDGLKIEALGPPIVEGSVLTYATDDEIYGGLWRPLPPAVFQQQPNPYYPAY